ncbi:nucleotide-diphospho-sugar transferase [Zalerion maritima]|uniref:Mannose-1-phosphate guanyltransferase n=1 Tax=Zalerion maritima TaxID=339359 RepID=A0AAD5RTV8_9PEZI|nr:nucleotide-diphospho-sugar transferase [Zalerion maritima]
MSSNKGGKGIARGKKGQSKPRADEKQEDVLKAVIIADTFQDRFMPFAVEKPRCLLPLANTPLIDYTLEFLSMNYVQEVYIYAAAHADQVKRHVETHPRWGIASKVCPFDKIEFIPVADATSMGDFLRDLDKRTRMETDFLMVHGDLVANIDLKKPLATHRARREENRNAMMTMVLRDAGVQNHHTKTQGITPVFTINPENDRCLAYNEMSPLDEDRYILTETDHLMLPVVDLRADLIDTGIDICTPEVLAMWSESFDYQLPRKNFLHGVLKDYELNEKMVFTEIIEKGYAARATNLQLYDAMTQDVLGRWTSPFVPDFNLMPGQTYKRKLDNVSLADGVKVTPSTHLSRSVVGSNSKFGAGTKVSNSIIGKDCTIGSNVTIKDSFIWDSVTVQNGTTVDHSIIADGAQVGKNCVIPVASLISFGVQICDGIQLAKETFVSTVGPDGISLPTDTSLVGPQGCGGKYVDEEEDDRDPAQLQKSLIYSTAHLNISAESISTFNSHPDSDSDSEPETPSPHHHRTPSQQATSGFHVDAVNGILDTLRASNSTGGDFDAARIEFTSLRLSSNASDTDVQRSIAVAFAKRAAELHLGQDPSSATPLEPAKAAERTVSVNGATKFLREAGVGGDANEKQVAFILALQQAVAGLREFGTAKAGTLLAGLLQQMYSNDVLDEDGIDAWWSNPQSQDGESMTAVRERVRVLVEWLQQAEEESEEGESEEEEE